VPNIFLLVKVIRRKKIKKILLVKVTRMKNNDLFILVTLQARIKNIQFFFFLFNFPRRFFLTFQIKDIFQAVNKSQYE